MIFKSEDDLTLDSIAHYGTPRHSGRYPWGSGDRPYQRNAAFVAKNIKLKEEGYSEHDRAKMLGCRNIDHLRAKVALANAELERDNIYMAQKLKDKGYSNVEIAKRMGIADTTVGNLLKRSKSGQLKIDAINNVKSTLVDEMNKNSVLPMLDVGEGTNLDLGISPDMVKRTLEQLKDEGYHVYTYDQMQQGTGKYTTMKVLCGPDVTWQDMYANRGNIASLADGRVRFEDNGNGEAIRPRPPQQIDQDRVYIRYAEDGGADRDGTIELRRGVEDLDMGKSKYAQVRICTDEGNYLKGMAVYRDDIPEGYDIVFNTNKAAGTSAEKVFKPMKKPDEPDYDELNPYGAAIKYGGQRGALNIVREEGDWADWSKTLPSQFLAKQSLDLARNQLKLTAAQKNEQFDDIMKITNATLRKKMLLDFGEECDADAVALKAASLPRQATCSILPVPGLKENEIYAPNFQNGEHVALVRFPHEGIFEIPQLVVNNKSKEARYFMENAKDAVGINAKTANILSGADFDGDTVIVIPNNDHKVKGREQFAKESKAIQAELDNLAKFDTKLYSVPEGCQPKKKGWKKGSPQEGRQMGEASNLITDMTLGGASTEEIIRAAKFAMVVIDTGKHKLDWGTAYDDFGIKELKRKYQGHVNENGNFSTGANTLISKAKGEISVPKHSDAYKPNPETGEKEYMPARDRKGRIIEGKTMKSTRMAEAKDARELFGNRTPTEMEQIYADYANYMKALGNKARKEYMAVKEPPQDKILKQKYTKEIESLNEKLVEAKKNAPLERKAQRVAAMRVETILEANPDMSKAEIKKTRGKALVQARQQVGAGKKRIKFTEKEWEAMVSGAVAKTTMEALFNNADQDDLMSWAVPKNTTALSPAKIATAKSMLAAGYTIAEVADHFGVSTTTISKST